MSLKLEGVFTALVTPFTEDGSQVDYTALEKLIDSQLEAGIDGLVPIGTTGESPTLSAEEKHKIIELCVKKAAGRCKVIAGTGSNNTAASIEATKKAKALGVDAVMIVNPYYSKPSQEGLYQHVAKIAEVGVPIVLYNIPGRTGILMEPATIARLHKDFKEVIAVKDAAGNLDITTETRSLCDITILSGDDSLTLPMMAVGGRGVISVLSNFKPERVQSIVKPALNGDFVAAAAALTANFKLIKTMFIETNPVPIKTAMAEAGLLHHSFRLPLATLNSANHEKLMGILDEYGILAKQNSTKKAKK